MKKRLFVKIFTGYLVIVLLVVSVMGYLNASRLKSSLTEGIRAELTAFGQIISLMPMADIRREGPALAKASGSRITLIDATGRVVLDTDAGAADLDNHYNRPEIRDARAAGQGSAIRYSLTLHTDMIYCALALRDGGRIKGYIRLAKPLVELQAANYKLYKMILQTIIIVLIPSLLIAMIFFFRILTPIRAIEEYTRKIQGGDKQAMLKIDTKDEIGSIARHINNMVQFQREKIYQLQEEKGKLESTFSSMLEGVMVLNAEHKIETCNKSMMDMIGAGFDDITGKTPIEVLRNITLQDALNSFLENGEPVTAEIAIGVDQQVVLEVSISAVTGLPGDGRKIMMVFHDITRLRQLERMRSDFVANVTHELKTPLTALVGFSETLLREKPSDEIADNFLRRINDNALRMDRLIDDLLTISNIEMGKPQLNPGEIPVFHIVEEALNLLRDQTSGKDLIVSNRVPPDLPPLWADKDKVFRIILNVISNAIKFTDSGRVEITASQDETGHLAIRIADTGIGIPKADIPRLGERFYRVDKARSRELGGTGLGLSIVKHLLKIQQGRMEVESKVGEGTTVTLFFPLDAERHAETPGAISH